MLFRFSSIMPTSSQFLTVCTQCKAFCCTLVRPPITEKEKHDILRARFKDFFIKVEEGIYEIRPRDSDKCPYLKNDCSCEIHDVKPKLCRIWPVVPQYKNKKLSYIVIKCPLFSYISKKEIQQAKIDAKTIPPQIIRHLWNISSKMKEKYKQFEYEEI